MYKRPFFVHTHTHMLVFYRRCSYSEWWASWAKTSLLSHGTHTQTHTRQQHYTEYSITIMHNSSHHSTFIYSTLSGLETNTWTLRRMSGTSAVQATCLRLNGCPLRHQHTVMHSLKTYVHCTHFYQRSLTIFLTIMHNLNLILFILF